MAKPKLALIPAAQGDKFYSVLPSDGVGDFTFTRASTGTRIAPTGLIEEVPSGDSRLDYDLLNGKVVNCPHYLLEPARTNSILYSEDFSQSYWTKGGASVVSDAAISPSGLQNADLIIEDTSNGLHLMYCSLSQVLDRADTISVYVKNVNSKYIQLTSNNTTTLGLKIIFDLELGVVDSELFGTGSIESVGNGWYRLTATGTSGSTGSTGVGFRFLDNSKNEQYIGNGSNSLYLWGFQYETISSYATSYIPTNGAAVTRAAETANGSGDAATFNDSEGVLMVEIAALADDLTNRILSLSNGAYNNSTRIGYNTTSNSIEYRVVSSSSIQAQLIYALPDIKTNNKISVKYKSNDFALWVNGFKVATDLSGLTSIGLDRLNFDDGGGAADFYGKTREVQYFDSALTDAQLETLTSWTSLQEMITSQLYTNY
jgi:hypothetical protein